MSTTRRRAVMMIVAAVGALCLAGCEREKTPADRAKVTAEQVRDKIGEALRTVGRYSEQERREYQKKALDKIRGYDDELKKLREKARKLGAEKGLDLDREIEKLSEKKAWAEARLKELESSGSEAWKDLKTGMDKALDDLDRWREKPRGEAPPPAKD
jgi:hypothetical protein